MKNLSVPLALIALLVIGLISYASDKRAEEPTDNSLDGKVVVINPSSISTPQENARIAVLADRKFVVYPVNPEHGNGFESWVAIEDVSRMLVFDHIEDAQAYLKRQQGR